MRADELRVKAEAGDADAQYELGYWYRNGGGGVEKDGAEAGKWTMRAAEQGHLVAKGLCFEKGYGVTEDKTEAVQWFRRSAAQGKQLSEGI